MTTTTLFFIGIHLVSIITAIALAVQIRSVNRLRLQVFTVMGDPKPGSHFHEQRILLVLYILTLAIITGCSVWLFHLIN